MDEQRFQAYVALIEQLLACPQGREGALLQASAELVDENLLGIMEQYATYLESQGNPNSGWLRGFATQLMQALRQETSTMDAEQFLRMVLQLVVDSQGDARQVHSFLAQHQEKLNESLLQTLLEGIETWLAGDREQQYLVAAGLAAFGVLISQFPQGRPWLNLELGIAAFHFALKVYTPQAFPEEWADTQMNLANTYSKRIRGESADNLEQAIAAYKLALQVHTRERSPEEWATIQHNLATAYCGRIQEDRADNLEQAIAAYDLALQIRTRRAFPELWAATQNNLANAYRDRIRGNRADNIERAITAYNLALEIHTRARFPEEWARIQSNLGIAYRERIKGERADNLEQAIAASKLAEQVYTPQEFPESWAATQNHLGISYFYPGLFHSK